MFIPGNYDGPISIAPLHGRKKVLVPADASAYLMKEILNSLPSVGSARVTRDGPNENNCFAWKVTFTSMLEASNCPHMSYYVFLDKGAFQALNAHNNTNETEPYTMTGLFDGRPHFELLGSESKIVFNDSLQRWQLCAK